MYFNTNTLLYVLCTKRNVAVQMGYILAAWIFVTAVFNFFILLTVLYNIEHF